MFPAAADSAGSTPPGNRYVACQVKSLVPVPSWMMRREYRAPASMFDASFRVRSPARVTVAAPPTSRSQSMAAWSVSV